MKRRDFLKGLAIAGFIPAVMYGLPSLVACREPDEDFLDGGDVDMNFLPKGSGYLTVYGSDGKAIKLPVCDW